MEILQMQASRINVVFFIQNAWFQSWGGVNICQKRSRPKTTIDLSLKLHGWLFFGQRGMQAMRFANTAVT